MPPTGSGDKSPDIIVEELIKENNVMIFSKTTCPFCAEVKFITILINF